MPKVKLTKNELKKERDALRQYNRYLPTLQLKKQQLQMEIVKQASVVEERKAQERYRLHEVEVWAQLLSDSAVDLKGWVVPTRVHAGTRNIAGVDIPVFERAEFAHAEYDLFLTPLWVDGAIDMLRALATLRAETVLLEKGAAILRQELRTTAQRVNLFEKVKIPEAEEAIRRIKIYIGDQMTNAVGRCKIAKAKIEGAYIAEASA